MFPQMQSKYNKVSFMEYVICEISMQFWSEKPW